ncbi:hypothetical protein ABTZ59_36050 [Streptomyces sp. NPDC094034]|uniref:hypothetical protein n=1 Tax=Streptomyces sp. NPDC094034 TaxID=3155309 RepID=UPI003331AD25
MPAPHDFPQDLIDHETGLQQTRTDYQALCATLPWSVDPAPGWDSDKQPYSNRQADVPDSPGYTDEQKKREAEAAGGPLDRRQHAPVLGDAGPR